MAEEAELKHGMTVRELAIRDIIQHIIQFHLGEEGIRNLCVEQL